MAPGGANDAGFWWSWRISSGFLSGVQCSVIAQRPFHQAFSMRTNPNVLFFVPTALLEKCIKVNSDVIEALGQSLIRTAELKYVWVDVLLRTGPHMHRAQSLQGCPISAGKCSSASAGRRAPEEACHQSSLLLQAGSSAPYQAEGKRRGENNGGQQIPLTNNQIGELV